MTLGILILVWVVLILAFKPVVWWATKDDDRVE